MIQLFHYLEKAELRHHPERDSVTRELCFQFGSATAKALAAVSGDPRDRSRQALPELTASLTDIADADCPAEAANGIDDRLGEMS